MASSFAPSSIPLVLSLRDNYVHLAGTAVSNIMFNYCLQSSSFVVCFSLGTQRLHLPKEIWGKALIFSLRLAGPPAGSCRCSGRRTASLGGGSGGRSLRPRSRGP